MTGIGGLLKRGEEEMVKLCDALHTDVVVWQKMKVHKIGGA